MISVCSILTAENFSLAKIAIEQAISRAGVSEIELLIVNKNNLKSVSKMLADMVADESRFPCIVRVGEVDCDIPGNDTSCYNLLVSKSQGKFICVFDCLNFVQNNWLYDLKHYYTLAENPGVASIAEFSAGRVYDTVLDKNDEFMNVWRSPDDSSNGVTFFDKHLLEEVGVFDHRLKPAYSMRQFSIRAAAIGKVNFYIQGQFRINCSDSSEMTNEQKHQLSIKNSEYNKMLQATMNEMRNKRNYYI